MKIQTFSVVAGSAACNARCPFCVSKMTAQNGIGLKEPEVNWRNFKKACRLAQLSNVTTVMITGKGEPTLFPTQVTQYLQHLEEFNFPLIEIQTNGIRLADNPTKEYLKLWYDLGLSTIAISTVHHDREKNREIFLPHRKEYINLEALINSIHEVGMSVRLVCTLAKDYIDSVEELNKYVDFAKKLGVEQIKATPVTTSDWVLANDSSEIHKWISKHALPIKQQKRFRKFLEKEGTKLMSLMHGAAVYDLYGQNICFSDCLTRDASKEALRQLIFFPDGHLRYDWQYSGAILL